ncbi:MAG TPA: RidA family protein [Chitinophagaceae bacterium]|nr:RidA family protein [Chitinophagaceae bacterium]
MDKQAVNPWKWQDKFSFSQAVTVSNATQTLVCAGQAAIDENGQPMHAGDMAAQLTLSLNNIDTVLTNAGYSWTDVIRLTVYTTDFDQLFQHYGLLAAKLENTMPKPVINLLGVNRLVFPELLVEIEATAMK